MQSVGVVRGPNQFLERRISRQHVGKLRRHTDLAFPRKTQEPSVASVLRVARYCWAIQEPSILNRISGKFTDDMLELVQIAVVNFRYLSLVVGKTDIKVDVQEQGRPSTRAGA